MIYGYLRVSTDEQDINSQKQGVLSFAQKKGWEIEEYITDEGISGAKDPDKRNLGNLLKKIKKDDIIIASEISRLGRDLYMVMDILHFCMKKECVIYTVKDNFILGNDMQSKVLAFAFGLAAEIERQMIQQRTREGLRLRVRMGVLLGRKPQTNGEYKMRPPQNVIDDKDFILKAIECGASFKGLAVKYGVNKDSMRRWCYEWGCPFTKYDKEKYLETERRNRNYYKYSTYKDTPPAIVELPWDLVHEYILQDLSIPEIHAKMPQYSYEQIYDSIYYNMEMNRLYRQHGQLKVKKRHY